MTKLAEIQDAILKLEHAEREKLQLWMLEAPLDLDEDSPELEMELLKGVRSDHTPYSSVEMRAICERTLRKNGTLQAG